MTLERIEPVIEHMARTGLDTRAISYLLAYPILHTLASRNGAARERFLGAALTAYGWMPRIVRIRTEALDAAVGAFVRAGAAIDLSELEDLATPIAECVFSPVGASKILHAASPAVFPIWDSRVQRFWDGTGREPSYGRMKRIGNYIAYARDVHRVTQLPTFHDFLSRYRKAHANRLEQLKLPAHEVTGVRAVEAAAFELAGPKEAKPNRQKKSGAKRRRA